MGAAVTTGTDELIAELRRRGYYVLGERAAELRRPVPKTKDEKVAFRKAWDARYDAAHA